MAFTFRTAEENFISALPSKVADLFYNDYYKDNEEEFKYLNKVFPFSLNAPGKEYIAERGIRVSPFATQTHSHPICKTFENHFLYNVLPRFVEFNSRLAVFSIKQTKAEYLYFRSRDLNLDVINRFMTAQDIGRYSKKTVLCGGRSNFKSFVHALVPRFKKSTPELLFFHDELMYWSVEDFTYFLRRINPSNLAFSFVYPVELLSGKTRSCNSLAYDFDVIGENFLFYPDGSKQMPYEQKIKNDWPLRYNSFSIPSWDSTEMLHFNLDLVESHGAHHFFVLSRGRKVNQEHRVFKDFDCTFFKNCVVNSAGRNLDGVIRTKILTKVFNYLVCLKKKDVESALAKLRQLTEGKLLKDELLIMTDLSNALSRFSLINDAPTLLDWINPLKLRGNLKATSPALDFLFGGSDSITKERLRLLSKNLKSFQFTLSCKEYVDQDFMPLQPFCPNSMDEDTETELNSDIEGDGSLTPSENDPIIFDDEVKKESQDDASEDELITEDEPTSDSENELDIKAWLNERKNGCFLTAVCSTAKLNPFSVLKSIYEKGIDCDSPMLRSACRKLTDDNPLLIGEMQAICICMNWRVWIYMFDDLIKLNDVQDLRPIQIGGKEGHVFKLENLNFFKRMGLIEKAYMELFGQMPQISKYRPNVHKAAKLIDSLSTMLLGALIDKRKVESGQILNKDRLKEVRSGSTKNLNFEVEILPFLGFAGSGKTRSLFNLINNSFLKVEFLWISPRRKVLEELLKKIDLSYGNRDNVSFKRQFMTFEKALLLKRIPKLVIIDESPLLPPGYLDLLLCKEGVSQETAIAMIGDPLQCKFHCKDSILMNNSSLDLFSILSERMDSNLQTDYLAQSFRFGTHPILSFIATQDKPFNILRLKEPSEESEAILVASEDDKRKNGSEVDKRVMTIGESQGCNFKRVSLILSNDLNLSDIGTLITGLSRASETLEIVCNPMEADFFLRYKNGANNCSLIMTQNAMQIHNLCKPLLKGLVIQKLIKAGHDFEIKLEGDPFLKSMLNMVIEPDLVEPKFEEICELECLPKTHLPLVETGALEVDCYSKMKSREFREFFVNGAGWSSQFDDTILAKGGHRANPCINPMNIFPRHKSDDQVTFWAAVKKRLIFSDPGTQLRKFKEERNTGKEILRVFLKYVPIESKVNIEEFNMAHAEFEEKKISKSSALIANHAIRSDTDWNERNIFLFMKSQLCKKKEKMFCDAKAGQTLACFAHSVLVKFSGICRYIEKKVSQALPCRFYIHQKKNFDDLEKFIIQNNFSGICTESDYEAFDSSQDHIALSFEVALMEFLNIDKSVIDDYIFIKTHLYCKLGEFAIMRFTGEFCTFLFNTLVNMAFTFMKYDIRGNTSICFAGDDMCANQRLSEIADFSNIMQRMRLKAKVDFTASPTFCGWQLSKYGIVKNPMLMCARLENSIYKNELPQVIDSYFLEFCFAYEKKDTLLDILSERDLDYHYILTRFFVKHASKLKGEARLKMMETKEKGRLMFGESTFGSDWLKFNSIRIETRCPLSTSRNSLSSRAEQTKKFSSMGLISQASTRTLECSNQKRQMSLKDFKSTLQSLSLQKMGLSMSMLHLLIQLKQMRSKSLMENTHCCIFQQFFYLSRDCSHHLSLLKEKCSFLMREAQGCVQQSKMDSNLICKDTVGRTTCTALITWSQSQTLDYIKVLSLDLNSVECISKKVQTHSILTSESCIDCSITLMKIWLRKWSENPNTKNCNHAIGCLTSVLKLNMKVSKLMRITSWKILVTSRLFQLEVTNSEESREKCQECGDIMQNLYLIKLGLIESRLKLTLKNLFERIRCTEPELQKSVPKRLELGYRMSAQHMLQEIIRNELRDYLWTNIVDPNNNMHLTPAQNAQLTQEQTQRKNLILDHFLRNLFGNIAISGASDKVSFLNMEIRLPAIPAAQVGQQEPLVIEHNLHESVGAIKAWRDNNASATIRGLTLRACCRPFANNAMDFLLGNPDLRTNLYYTQPHNYGRAPEVAFDFADGITPNRLANNKDRQFVLSALASRTFNHEAKKGVFEAQGAVNFTFDG